MGKRRTDIVTNSEQVIGLAVATLAEIPETACEGQMTFVKRSSGDSVYIRFKGGVPSPTAYDVVLTDNIPFYTEDGVIVGEIKALGSDATSSVSTYCSYSNWKKEG